MSDTIIKVSNKTENFTVVTNEVARRDDLSARAKGIYFYLMTLPKDWKLFREELNTHFTEGKDALNTAFKELENAGYISKKRVLNNTKFAGWEYTIYETASVKGLSDSGNPKTENPYSGNPQLLNTDSLLSTNKQNNEIKVLSKQNKTQDQFLIFYQNYPKKTNKTDARKTFNRLIKSGVSLDSILSKLTIYKKQIEKDQTDIKYIKNPQRFLNCLDDYETEEEKKPVSEKRICPSCGSALSGLFCKTCFTQYNEKMEATF